MKKEANIPVYSLAEEMCNSITHGIGFLLAVVALTVGIVVAAIHSNAYGVVSMSIYGACMMILYCMSTLYHSITNKTAKKVFRVFDHSTIYLLIAGTYTPIALVTLNGAVGWTIFGIVWGISALGIVLNSVNLEKFKTLSLISYIVLGWTIAFAAKPLLESLDKKGVLLMLAGGLAYTLGIVFYKMKKIRFMHSVWHLFVLAGTVLQYFSILLYVLPLDKQYTYFI